MISAVAEQKQRFKATCRTLKLYTYLKAKYIRQT